MCIVVTINTTVTASTGFVDIIIIMILIDTVSVLWYYVVLQQRYTMHR